MSKYSLPGASPEVETLPPVSEAAAAAAHDDGDARSLGEIIRETRNLTAEQVEKILAHQQAHGLRFGEAAVALGYVDADDVLAALAQQFHYPYVAPENRQRNPELVALNAPFSAQAEAFRRLRSQVVMRTSAAGDVRGVIAVISPNRKDGRSFMAANLALVLAQLGGRTLLLDANLREPRLHAMFGLQGGSGLSRVLLGRTEEGAIQPVQGVPSLFVLPAGPLPPNPAEMLERPAFALLMRELAGKFDHVIVDTAAAEIGADAAVVASRCGSALIVARKNRARIDALQALTGNLSGAPVELLGVVTNDH